MSRERRGLLIEDADGRLCQAGIKLAALGRLGGQILVHKDVFDRFTLA